MKPRIETRRSFVGKTASAAAGLALAPALVGSRALGQGHHPRPAALGGPPLRSDPYLGWPTIDGSDEARLLDALRRREWCRLYGDITTEFERRWAELLGVRYCTGVVNGTNALYAALNALEVGPGEEVIVPPYTFVATVNAVLQQFALPVFCDSDPETFQLDPATLQSRVGAATRCLMPVHLGGGTADMDAVGELARTKGLAVIEDACQAHFAEWKGRRVGGLGDIGCFSFQASKILPCGEGGALVTNREELLDRFHAFQNNGRDRLTGTRDGYRHHGSNLRITELQSALLLAQLARFDETCRRREANARHLTRLLDEIPGVTVARDLPGCTRNTYYLLMFRYDGRHFAELPLERFVAALEQEGIPVWRGYRPLNREPFLKTTLESKAFRRIYPARRLRRYWEENQCPANDRLCAEGVFLQQEALLGSRADAEQVAEAVEKIRVHAEALKEA